MLVWKKCIQGLGMKRKTRTTRTRKRTIGGMYKIARQNAKRNLMNNAPSLHTLQEQYKQILQAKGESPILTLTPTNNTRKNINLEERFKRLAQMKAQV
jgi:hypothetical protein